MRAETSALHQAPPVERWDDWVEPDPKHWPRRVARHYELIPTICFNCEAACGLLAYVDKETGEVARFCGNPLHPGSRGRTCAKGPAVASQIHDPDRILYPQKRAGRRGEGKWQRVSWDEVLETIGARVRHAILEGRGEEVMYHVGRPGHDLIMERVLQAWGIDGHNSHTNICSAAARLGYVLWHHADRPSPDHTNARLILLLSAHLESGHYFNPHAQRIIEGKMNGARLVVMDPRLSNTASMADEWLPTYPGSEAAVLLAMATVILDEGRFDASFVETWTNWEEYDVDGYVARGGSFEGFIAALRKHYAGYTPEHAARESGVAEEAIVLLARQIADAGPRFSSHVWRGAASGNLGGFQVARALVLLHVLTGSIGTKGGHSINAWNKLVPRPFSMPGPQKRWNPLLYAPEWPLSHHEQCFLLPHFLTEGRGRIDTYFTRVFNPVWTLPDGLSWMEMLEDEGKVGLHAALTPFMSETAWLADYVLPMGLSSERHDLMSQETHAGVWIGFRQPVLRVFKERRGERVARTFEANPGEVWEEDEFWIALSWAIDPDGAMGIRQYFESPYRPGERITVDEYYGYIFENSVPGLPEAASREGMTPLAYMRRYGCFEVAKDVYRPYADVSFQTPSRKLEIYSTTLAEWKWPEQALPEYMKSHVHQEAVARAAGGASSEMDGSTPGVEWPPDARGETLVLLPIFRLPTLIHTRSGNARLLYEIAHRNPLWVARQDALRLGVETGSLLKVHTEIGWFVLHAWVTEGLLRGVVACSHHLGRWRLSETAPIERSSSALVDLIRMGDGCYLLRQRNGVLPYASADPDTSRIWWRDAGVHQNLAFPVHPDPVSGMHCWHQIVKVEKAGPDDRYGDVFVDTRRSQAVYQKWKSLARPAPGPGGLRRPLWLPRVARPAPEAYVMTPVGRGLVPRRDQPPTKEEP